MLLFMDEEDAFWLLATVIGTMLPFDYYTHSMIGTYVDLYVLADFIRVHLPRVHR